MSWDELGRHRYEGKLVEIHSLPAALPPNLETKAVLKAPADKDFNGHGGRCLKWDEEEQRYIVHTFEGVLVGIPEANVLELEPKAPESGGFDVVWPATSADNYELFADSAASCLATKGYCMVQMFTNPRLRESAVREADSKPAFADLRAETAVGYLGTSNSTRCGILETDTPDKLVEDALSYCDRDLTNMAFAIEPFTQVGCGFTVHGRSNAFVRTSRPGGEELALPELSGQDIEDQAVEQFVSWMLRRRLCFLYLIENAGGALELYPSSPEFGETIRLPLRNCRMVIFRHDLLGYSYQPEGDSLALQMWLLDEPQVIEFRQLPQPPGTQGLERVQMVSATERFPANCDDCNMTWNLFCAGTDAQQEVPFERFDKDLYVMDDRDAIMYGKAYIMHGSMVREELMHAFDNDFFGIPYEEACTIGPAQRWVMEVGYETLHRAGWRRKELLGQRIGTFMGDSGSEWNQVWNSPSVFNAASNMNQVTITRLGHLLGLTGPNISVDTACSASLVAANAACHMMRNFTYLKGREDPLIYKNYEIPLKGALCMGVLVMLHPAAWIGECASTMLSYRGRCFTYDSSADGFIRGEGCCSAYLKGQNDFDQEATERSLATIMGTCVNQDGRSASLTAPHGPSQQECIRQCLREAHVKPGEVMVGECHGTGTALGDPIEVGSVRGVMHGKRDTPHIHCTAKAHVGHEEANAGICGLIKIVLMLNASTVTPNPHLRALNPHLDVNSYPILFNTELHDTGYTDQIFGVSSFGFGGTNSRAECWAEPEKGMRKTGVRTLLTKKESIQWINKMIDNNGTERQLEGFVGDHKSGH